MPYSLGDTLLYLMLSCIRLINTTHECPFAASRRLGLSYSLTLVDSLDTLAILGDFQQFNNRIRDVIARVRFDSDLIVSVFETNIRILGGLLSAHVLASELSTIVPILSWYTDELLVMAEDLGTRLLPAFNTTTGIPHGRINLRRGMEGVPHNRETCTACAGTIILEFAALSRLTGNPIFEQKATIAMDRLWRTRHRTSELMGTTIDVQSGDWVRKDSGVGAGIDSYYEYCLKAYILLGDTKYLKRFNRHYNAIKKYISRGPLMMAVYMHRPHLQSRNFMDALLAFWPGLQVMMGDLRPAVETHEMLYQVMQRHTFIPEAFTSDFQVHWGQHPLRPEFLESTYFLHRATGDDHYLRVGRDIMRALQQHARVPCGYAAVNDVRTRVHEDRMDSFVLAETFKYLYMLFSEDADLPVDITRYVMTTEAHFLPLSLGRTGRNSTVRIVVLDDDDDDKTKKTCPSMWSLVPAELRLPMRHLVGGSRPLAHARALTDPRQIAVLADLGISVVSMPDGRVQLLYTTATAKTPNDAAEGLTFMNEMSKWNSVSDNGVELIGVKFDQNVYSAGPAHFGKEISGQATFQGKLALVAPPDACSEVTNKEQVAGRFGIAFRGTCTFIQKVRNMQSAGVRLAIIIDNMPTSSSQNSALFAMSNDGNEVADVVIPAIFLYTEEGNALIDAFKQNPELMVTLAAMAMFQNVESSVPRNCLGDPIMPTNVPVPFSNLKLVLSELVAQFRLSLNVDEPLTTNYAERRNFNALPSNKILMIEDAPKGASVNEVTDEDEVRQDLTRNEENVSTDKIETKKETDEIKPTNTPDSETQPSAGDEIEVKAEMKADKNVPLINKDADKINESDDETTDDEEPGKEADNNSDDDDEDDDDSDGGGDNGNLKGGEGVNDSEDDKHDDLEDKGQNGDTGNTDESNENPADQHDNTLPNESLDGAGSSENKPFVPAKDDSSKDKDNEKNNEDKNDRFNVKKTIHRDLIEFTVEPEQDITEFRKAATNRPLKLHPITLPNTMQNFPLLAHIMMKEKPQTPDESIKTLKKAASAARAMNSFRTPKIYMGIPVRHEVEDREYNWYYDEQDDNVDNGNPEPPAAGS